MKKIRISGEFRSTVVEADKFEVVDGYLYIYRYRDNRLETFSIIPPLRWTAVWFVDDEGSPEE